MFCQAIFGAHRANETGNISSVNSESRAKKGEDQTEKDSREDSEGDGLVLFDDPMFPPEFDDEDDDL